MTKAAEAQKGGRPADIGDNSKKMDEDAINIVKAYSESLARSAEENDIRAELRDKWEDLGQDKKALQDGVNRSKKSLKKREGYDESMAYMAKIVDEIGGAETLFKWAIEKEDDKQKERDEKRAEQQKQKEAAKESDDTFKPAPDRKPKALKSVGAEQADAVLAAGKEKKVEAEAE